MKMGDKVLVKGKIIDCDSNPHGSALLIELDLDDSPYQTTSLNITKFWVHRLEQLAIRRTQDAPSPGREKELDNTSKEA